MLTSKWLWLLRRATRRMDIRAIAISILGLAAAPLALLFSPYVSNDLARSLGSDAVGNLLTVLASSMLTITTFSLSTVVAVFASSSQNTSPRATSLLMRNPTTQNMLSTFIGAFIFSLTGLILLQTQLYNSAGRLALFAMTLLVIALVVITLLRWIDFILRLGRIGYITGQVEAETTDAITERASEPYLGGMALTDAANQIPPSAWSVTSPELGYVLHIDLSAIQACVGSDRMVYLLAIPGALMHPNRVLARVTGERDEELETNIRDAYTFGPLRTHEQDPRFGIITLSEIASKALSPGINDPGTAIDVISRQTRILAKWNSDARPEKIHFPNIYAPPLSDEDLIRDAFNPIARDGAGNIEVQIRLQKSLASLAHFGNQAMAIEARKLSDIALTQSEAALTIEHDRQLLRKTIEDAFSGIEPLVIDRVEPYTAPRQAAGTSERA